MGDEKITLEENIQERADYIKRYFISVGVPHLVDENCSCGHKRSEHADIHFNYDGHGRCLRCTCDQFTYKSFIEVPPPPRMAFFVMETNMNSQGEYNALIAVENERGYYKTDWFWGKDFKKAQEIADERNFRMGLSRKEAAMIQCSTMRSVKMPEADDIDEPDDAALERHAGADKPEVWTRFDITTLHPVSQGKEVEIVMRTNDDDDDGVAGEITEWRKITTMQIALALSGGKSHMGGYGQPVTVTLDGKQI